MNKELGSCGEKLIKSAEKLKLIAYMPTPDDRPTIGWGHTLGVELGDKITESKAQEFFKEDIASSVTCVNKNVKVGLTQNQFDACVSLCFNIGCYNFRNSTLVARLNAEKYLEAADQFLVWTKQRKNGVLKELGGLVTRRALERALFLSGDSNA